MRQGPQPMMSRGFRAVSVRREGKVFETRFTEAHGIRGPEGLVGIAGRSVTVTSRQPGSGANGMDRFAAPLRPYPESWMAGSPGRTGRGARVSLLRWREVPSMTASTPSSANSRRCRSRTSSMAAGRSPLAFGGMHRYSLSQGFVPFFSAVPTVPSGTVSTVSSPPGRSAGSRIVQRLRPSGGCGQARATSLPPPPPPGLRGFRFLRSRRPGAASRPSPAQRRRTRPAAGTPVSRTGAMPEPVRPPSSRAPSASGGIRACRRLYAAAPLSTSLRGSALPPSERRIRYIPRPFRGVPVPCAMVHSVP